MKIIKTLASAVVGLALINTPTAFSAPVANSKIIHTTVIHTNRELASGWVTVQVGQGDQSKCEAQELVGYFSLPKVKEGDTFQLAFSDLPTDNLYTCTRESFYLFPTSVNANKNVEVIYSLRNNGKSYTAAVPSEQEINIK